MSKWKKDPSEVEDIQHYDIVLEEWADITERNQWIDTKEVNEEGCAIAGSIGMNLGKIKDPASKKMVLSISNTISSDNDAGGSLKVPMGTIIKGATIGRLTVKNGNFSWKFFLKPEQLLKKYPIPDIEFVPRDRTPPKNKKKKS